MELNLRQAITQRVQGKSKEELLDIVEGSVGGEEQALPGLGVIFEMIWAEQGGNQAGREGLVEALYEHLQASDKVPSAT